MVQVIDSCNILFPPSKAPGQSGGFFRIAHGRISQLSANCRASGAIFSILTLRIFSLASERFMFYYIYDERFQQSHQDQSLRIMSMYNIVSCAYSFEPNRPGLTQKWMND